MNASLPIVQPQIQYDPLQRAGISMSGVTIERIDPLSGKTFFLEVEHFEAGPFDRIGIVGESGSGKTTLLEMLGLLTWPTSVKHFSLGEVGTRSEISLLPEILSRDASALAKVRSQNIGFVLQDGGLLPYLTVFENAMLAANLSRGPGEISKEKIEASAAAIGIVDLLHRLPSQLSGGQRQRAAVLRALAPGVGILLGDEPTASLDQSSSNDVMRLLTEHQEKIKAAIIVASHDEPILARYGFNLMKVIVEEFETSKRARLVALS